MGRNAAATNFSNEEKNNTKRTMKIAKFCRFNTPNKKCKIRKEEYDYFTAHDAIETLMKSKFMEKDGEKVPRAEKKSGKLYTRDDCTLFFKHLVHNRMAGRCQKKYKDPDQAVEDKKPSDKKTSDDDAKKAKKKFKVVPHGHQGFFDDEEEVYIWIWNPTPFMHWVYGCGVLLVVIGGTLFPLWPDTLRTGVYYTSLSLAGFIGTILVVGLLRTIVFAVLWAATGGKHNFWFLPNLLADVGFFESFVPVYTYDVYDSDGNKVKAAKKKKQITGADGEEVEGSSEASVSEEAKKDK